MRSPDREQTLAESTPNVADAALRSIVVVTDLSAREGMALHRATQLAELHRASLVIVYMPAHAPKRAEAAPPALARIAKQLAGSLGVSVTATTVPADRLQDLAAVAERADLLVLPHRRERSTAAFFRGQPVARLLRLCKCPVLVARAPAGARYRRVLVAVDLSPASESLVKLAFELDPQAELEVFHAICTEDEIKLRSSEATEQAVRAYRLRCLAHAQGRMVALTDSFAARRNRFLTTVGRGDPGRQVVIQQERARADLVVVGKKATTAWEDFLSASVAHRVLSWGTTDVLVVPHRHAAATAATAARRMQAAGMRPALALGRSAGVRP